ncbi:MAG: hypothetical protein ACE5GB_14220, partial [Acidimicrobiales bacterium]
MPLDTVSASAAEEPKSIVETLDEIRRCQSARPGGSELDGQRHTIEPPADLDHRLRISADLEGRVGRPCSGVEELDCRAVHLEGADDDELLIHHPQTFAGGREDTYLGTRPRDGFGERRRAVHHVFAVVQENE